MIERYEELVRENKRLKAQLQTFRQSHYQTQAALARSAIAGEIKQQPIKPSLAFDASVHLSNWLNMNLCECEGAHTCGYNDVKRTRDALLEAAEQRPAPDVERLVEALEQCITSMLDCGYRANALVIRAARAALAAYRKGGEL